MTNVSYVREGESSSSDVDFDELMRPEEVVPFTLDAESLMAIEGPERGPLSNVHLRELMEGSAIPFGTLARAGLYTERDPKVVTNLLGRSDKRIQDQHVPALVIPYFMPDERGGDVAVTHRVKPAEPLAGRDGKAAKYLSPIRKTEAPRLFLGPDARGERWRWKEVRAPLVIVEGEKKTLAVEAALAGAKGKSGAGYLVVGIAGVSMWQAGKDLLPDFNLFDLRDRTVTILFDADAEQKEQIDSQREKLAAALHLRGAVPRIARIPELKKPGKTGADDYLVHGLGKPEALKKPEEHKSLDQILRNGYVWATPAKVEVAEAVAGLALTEHQLARAFGDAVKDHVRYVLGEENWYVWNKRIWEPVVGGRVREITKAWLATQLVAARKLGDKAYIRLVSRMDSPRGVSSLLEALRSDRRFEVQPSAFNTQEGLLTAANGVVDFTTGALSPFDPKLMRSMIANASFEPSATAEEWDALLRHLFPNDEVRAYLQRCVGASITGRGVKHFFLVVGPGHSGKSTFMAALRGALGSYWVGSEFKTFCAHKASGPNQARSDLVRLAGKRVICASEVSKGQKLDLGRVKALTGGEGARMPLRSEFGKTAEYCLSGKLWLVANPEDLPRIDDDDAAWNRVVKFPLGGAVPTDGQNVDWLNEFESGERFEHVRRAALAWAVKGAVDFFRDGLGPVPAAILAAKTETRGEMEDYVVSWLRDAVVFERGALTANADLYKAYEASALDEGERRPLSKRAFALALKKAGLAEGVKIEGEEAGVKVSRDGRQVHGWRGVRLIPANTGRVDLNDLEADLFS